MNLTGFENTKNLADNIQKDTQGEQITNTTGSNNVNTPVNDDISSFNKGVETMYNIGNHHIVTEATKMGTYRPDIDPEDHPFIGDIREKQSTKRLEKTIEEIESKDKPYFEKEAEKRKQEEEQEKKVEEEYAKMQEKSDAREKFDEILKEFDIEKDELKDVINKISNKLSTDTTKAIFIAGDWYKNRSNYKNLEHFLGNYLSNAV